MNRIIIGDLVRILKKIGFYILPVIYFLLYLVDINYTKNSSFEEQLDSVKMSCDFVLPFVTGIPIFLGVYADELKAGAMQTSIGRGISRRKIAVSKFVVCVLLAAIIMILDMIVEYGVMRHYFIIPSSTQMKMYVTTYLAAYLKTVGAMAFSAIFIYITWNASIGIVVLIISLSFAESTLGWIQSQFHIPVLDYSYIGQVDQACNSIAANAGWIVPLLVVIIYVVVFNAVSIAIFRRKELEL